MNIKQPLQINPSQLWRRWVLATTVAAVLGMIISQLVWLFISNNLELNADDGNTFCEVPVYVWMIAGYIFLTGCTNALCRGGFQWLVLQRLARPFGWWFWAAAAPLILIAAGNAMYFVVYDIFPFRPYFDPSDKLYYIIKETSQLFELAFSSLMVGLLQWLILRQVTYRSAWWIPAGAAVYFLTVIANLICRYVIIEHYQENLEVLTSWIIFFTISLTNTIIIHGALLGWLLVWLLKRPPPLTTGPENPGE